MRRLIGLTGYRGVGKSSVSAYLVETHGYVRRPFAGPLKNMLRAIGLSESDLDGSTKEVPSDILNGQTPRFAMQTLGTQWGRDTISQTLWLDLWTKSTVGIASPIVVDDLRFPNEADIIKSRGGVVIRIRRPGHMASAHASEIELDMIKPDWVIHNAGGMEDLAAAIESVIQ